MKRTITESVEPESVKKQINDIVGGAMERASLATGAAAAGAAGAAANIELASNPVKVQLDADPVDKADPVGAAAVAAAAGANGAPAIPRTSAAHTAALASSQIVYVKGPKGKTVKRVIDLVAVQMKNDAAVIRDNLVNKGMKKRAVKLVDGLVQFRRGPQKGTLRFYTIRQATSVLARCKSMAFKEERAGLTRLIQESDKEFHDTVKPSGPFRRGAVQRAKRTVKNAFKVVGEEQGKLLVGDGSSSAKQLEKLERAMLMTESIRANPQLLYHDRKTSRNRIGGPAVAAITGLAVPAFNQAQSSGNAARNIRQQMYANQQNTGGSLSALQKHIKAQRARYQSDVDQARQLRGAALLAATQGAVPGAGNYY